MSKHRICATATGLPKLTRRNFVTAAAATPLAALPIEASSGNLDYRLGYAAALNSIIGRMEHLEANPIQSPIQKLFPEWKKALDYSNLRRNISEEELAALCDITEGFEKKILQQQITSKEDLAAKILTYTAMGAHDIDKGIIEECKVLKGV